MIRLANNNSISQVLSELKEYAAEVDVDFVRKSVRAIGRCAIKVEQSAERCKLIFERFNYFSLKFRCCHFVGFDSN